MRLRALAGTSYTLERVGRRTREQTVPGSDEPPRQKRDPKEAQAELFKGIGRGRDALEQRFSEKWGGMLAGVDEVGRGPLAGPVVAAAVILPADHRIRGITDSKALTPEKREELDALIREKAIAFGIGSVDPDEIDRINILNASLKAMALAIAALGTKPAGVLIDGVFRIPGVELPQQPVVKGDLRCRCIGAASIVAKVHRDRVMTELEKEHPGYGFAEHKGYGCESHRKAIRKLGPSPVHRRSFGGVLAPEVWEVERGQRGLFSGAPEALAKEGGDDRRPRAPHLERGEHGEGIALEYLLAKGWTLVERNWRCPLGEIDLIVTKDDVLAFVEVKSREVAAARGFQPDDAVNHVKQRKLERTARAWLQQNEERAEGFYPRFDVISVVGKGAGEVVEHLEDAFEARGG